MWRLYTERGRLQKGYWLQRRTPTMIQISSPGLCPSNHNVGFPNLARRESFAGFAEDVIEDVTATCKAELEAAGITPFMFSSPQGGEVPSKARGSFGMWGFERAWYYWRASGPGLPVEVAERLHAEHGKSVRVDGHCGCPSPREWFKGFGVGSYHVDSPEGLKVLIDALRSVYDPTTDPDATPRTGKVK